jgi:hypothetical protein
MCFGNSQTSTQTTTPSTAVTSAAPAGTHFFAFSRDLPVARTSSVLRPGVVTVHK